MQRVNHELETSETVRVVVSLAFFILFGALFLDFANLIPEPLRNALTSLQLAPSILKILTGVSLVSLGLLIVLSRRFCSVVSIVQASVLSELSRLCYPYRAMGKRLQAQASVFVIQSQKLFYTILFLRLYASV